MLKTNQHYFNLSVANPESLDKRYMRLEWHTNISQYVRNTKKLKELLATIKTLKNRSEDAERIYSDLHELMRREFTSKSEFSCFINACDSTAVTLSDDFASFKKIVDLYLEHRDFTEETPKEWIQAVIDRGASRSQGVIGENKLIELSSEQGFVHIKSWDELLSTEKAVAKFSKNRFDIPQIRQKLGIDLNFNTQGKMLDIILKNGENYMFLEAKHLKEGGGSQDKQIHELINILQNTVNQSNILFGAFMDGVYSNKILNNKESENESDERRNKLATQRQDIKLALQQDPASFWFNTAGFSAFISDFAL